MRRPKGSTKKKKVETANYSAILIVFGQTYKASGMSAQEAISNLIARNVKGKGILMVTHGDKKRERIIMPRVLFQLFNGGRMAREIGLKNISLLFSDL